MTIILGIETSCDETAAAVIQDGEIILSNVVASQIKSQRRFGGVVPEVASRHHVEQITLVIDEALEQAGVTPKELDAVAVTEGPGLVGALLIGIHAAKAFAFAHQLPIIGVHHIVGHIYANAFVEPMKFPALALIVSGGHTELVVMKGHGQFEKIGETRDDAAGEAFDKVARVIGLPYPGGPEIDRLAQTADEAIEFPRAWLEEDSYDFSFSGLKSAVMNYHHNAQQRGEDIHADRIARGFQESVIDVLVERTVRAAKEFNVQMVIAAGGVSANKGLRTALTEALKNEGIVFSVPPIHLCTDNAAMIGAAGHAMYVAGIRSDLAMNGNPSLPMRSWK